jgi:shikimate dehydrogenase
MSDADPVLTLTDLETWSFDGTALAVLGQPIKHSVSPPMHNAALAEMAQLDARFASWKYFRFEVPPTELPRALALLHQKKFRGVNLTVPHKVLAVEQLTAIDPAARLAGAVNTLLWTEDGWHGFNTDGYGLSAAIAEDLGLRLKGSHIVLLGAGGAARGAAVECLAQKCASLTVINRTPANLEALLTLLRPLAGEIPLRGETALGETNTDILASAVVINATSLGLRETDAVPINLRALKNPIGVYDMIYNPPRTALLAHADALAVPRANGLSMLIHQGAKSLSIWSAAAVPVSTMRTAAETALRR